MYQQIENNVLQPVIYSKTVALSPLTVLVASLAGAAVAGVIGVLIAIPLAAAGYILVQDLLERRKEEVVEADAEAQEELPGELGAGRVGPSVGAQPMASERGGERGGVEPLREADEPEDRSTGSPEPDPARSAVDRQANGEGEDAGEERPPASRMV